MARPDMAVVQMHATKFRGQSLLGALGLYALASLSIGTNIAIAQNKDGPISDKGAPPVIGSVSTGNTIGMPPFQECSKGYLQLQLNDRIGTLIMRGRDDARRFRLVVGNPTQDCTAIVNAISVEVVDYGEDHHGALEALMATFVYRKTISPLDKGKRLPVNGNDRFTYPPRSNPDQFVVDVSSAKDGYGCGSTGRRQAGSRLHPQRRPDSSSG